MKWMRLLPLLVAVLAMSPAAAVRSSRRLRNSDIPKACGFKAYTEFRSSFRSQEIESLENTTAGEHRQALFERRCQAVLAQNVKPGATWRASVNHFADRTDAELRMHLGYKRTGFSRDRHGMPSVQSALSLATPASTLSLPESVDWRRGLKSAWNIRTQGSCGSCWAMASAGAVEMHAELADGNKTFVSPAHLVQCVPNPQHCGGTGGCDGATAELAFQFIKQHGIRVERSFGSPLDQGPCGIPEGRRAMIRDFVQLPANRAEPLVQALASHGPVVVGVDASNWFNYGSGIYNSCRPDATVNHAVLAVGYARDAYILRNSWGLSWGERGHMRLQRLGGSGDGHCGVDQYPQEGNGCEDGPSEMPVCGMCGVLSDAAYPVGAHVVDEVVTSL
mmetsp:Transcript_83902/g.246034  ORF Transcript_83902/g.246034 Transcript_83902/m.246034 type:complete len:391 (-) Transcript_83902:172-1344(-)